MGRYTLAEVELRALIAELRAMVRDGEDLDEDALEALLDDQVLAAARLTRGESKAEGRRPAP